MPLANSAINCSITLLVIFWRFCSDSTRDLESDVDCLESTFKLRFGKVRLVQGDWFLEASVQEVGLRLVSNNLEIKRFPRGRLSTTAKLRDRSLPVSLTVQPVLSTKSEYAWLLSLPFCVAGKSFGEKMHKLNFPVARIGCFLQSTHTFVFIWNQGKNYYSEE